MKKLLWLISVIFIPLVHAENDMDNLFSLSLEELMKTKVTGSTLTPEHVRTVPAAVTVYTHQELSHLGLDTLNELMNLIPGFQTYRSSTSPASYSTSSRSRRIGFSAAEILILVDGQRLNDPRNSGSTPAISNFPLMNIERVEFLRGPGAAVYGSNAMMGVINIITRSNANEVSVNYGEFNRQKVYLLASHQINDLAMDLFAHFDTDEGEEYWLPDTFSPSNILTDDPKKITDINFKLAWKSTFLNFQHKNVKTTNFYELAGISNHFNHNKDEQNTVSIKHTFNWLSVSSYAWLSYHQTNIEMSSQLTAPNELLLASGGVSDEPLFAHVNFDGYGETRTLWHNRWVIDAQQSLQFGFEFRHLTAPQIIAANNFDLGDLANKNFPIPYYGSLLPTTEVQVESHRNIWGVYGQYQQQLFDSSHLTLGLRYDNFSKIGAEFTPRLAWVQELNDIHSLKLLYGEAFRAPSEAELNLVNNPVLLGNTELKPESVNSLELIWLGQWSDINTSIGYFENHFENSIVEINISDGTRQYQNIKQEPIKGIEVEISHQLTKHWLIRASYTHINEKPTLAYRESEQLASLMVNYQYKKWNANIISSYHGKRETPTGGNDTKRLMLEAYWKVFAKLNYSVTTDLQAYIQVKNLLNEQYWTPAISANLTQGIPNKGREALLGLVWHY